MSVCLSSVCIPTADRGNEGNAVSLAVPRTAGIERPSATENPVFPVELILPFAFPAESLILLGALFIFPVLALCFFLFLASPLFCISIPNSLFTVPWVS